MLLGYNSPRKRYSSAIMNNLIMDRDSLSTSLSCLVRRIKDPMSENASTGDVNFLVETAPTMVIKFF